MKRTAMLAAGIVAGAALMFGPAVSAQALWVLPSSGPMTDAAGNTNGCTAAITPINIGPVQGAARALRIEMTFNCPESANVHRTSDGLTLLKVLPDGSLEKMFSGTFAKASSGDVMVGGGTAGSYIPCSQPGYGGTNTWVARALIKVKQSKEDTNPFIAKVHSSATLTC